MCVWAHICLIEVQKNVNLLCIWKIFPTMEVQDYGGILSHGWGEEFQVEGITTALNLSEPKI